MKEGAAETIESAVRTATTTMLTAKTMMETFPKPAKFNNTRHGEGCGGGLLLDLPPRRRRRHPPLFLCRHRRRLR
jgi:hypothetical protein